jgi:hypothetical protein
MGSSRHISASAGCDPIDPQRRTTSVLSDRAFPFQKELRAMNRRRFVPSPEGLEGRSLLTSFNVNTLFGLQLYPNLNVPITFQQKSLRIQHLPYYLEKIRPGRFLPKPEIEQIQSALFNMVDAIHKPPPTALNNYNYQLRHVVSKQSFTSTDINRLNYSFTATLKAAKAPHASINGLNSALFQMVSQVDTASVLPVFLGTNDYSLTLQTALAIGRPMPAPALPKIAKNHGIQAGSQHIKTPLTHPTLAGTYHFHTSIQLVTPQGGVAGTAIVHKNNNYKLIVSEPLSVGIHEFRVRAVDTVGHLSRISKPFLIKVVPKKHRA